MIKILPIKSALKFKKIIFLEIYLLNTNPKITALKIEYFPILIKSLNGRDHPDLLNTINKAFQWRVIEIIFSKGYV